MLKKLNLALLLLLMAQLTMAQMTFDSPKKAPQLGLSANLVDFSASLPKIGKVDPGFSVMFWNGITNHLDYSLRYNGLFSKYLKAGLPEKDRSSYKNEFEGALHLKALSDDHLINPFVTGGFGLGYYAKQTCAFYVPLGVGVQANLASKAYIYLQANYRVPVIETNHVDKNMFYSLGIAATIKRRERPAPPPPPVVVEEVKDTDNDGIPDHLDACPTEAGPKELNGCPDRDGDGVPDKDDACPDVPGPASNKGCPEVKQEVKEEVKKVINEAASAIYFITNGHKLENRAFPALSRVLTELNKDIDLKLDISGHTDNVGTEEYNQGLSERRAKSVYDYLTEKGINPSRLSSAGYGELQPVAPNTDAKGRQLNRRTEMKLRYN